MKIRDEAYQYYFFFLQERMDVFWRRQENPDYVSSDKILSSYKFTNVYRVLDRVSQYLVKNVIYENGIEMTSKDILLRILIFKIFNRIDTWQYLEHCLGERLTTRTFDVDLIINCLTERIQRRPIFNSAYIMTGSHDKYRRYRSKHERWLRMIEQEFLLEGGFEKIIACRSMEEVFNSLLEKSFIGGFLAYQYAVDFNYSSVFEFNENSFVKAGIGAKRGIDKCFSDKGDYSYEDLIRFTQDNLLAFQEKYGYLSFKGLPSRTPTLIDLQNCFCETDKYLRARMPELQGGNKRIKQKFKPKNSKISYFFPPKWGTTIV